VKSISLDIEGKRGTSDTYDHSIEFESTDLLPWQLITMEVYRDDLGPDSMTLLLTQIEFTGVVYFQFVQDDFSGIDKSSDLYDVSPLNEAGFHIDMRPFGESDGWSKHGAFCLWSTEDSPLIRKMAAAWAIPEHPIELRARLLKHYRISCDETGEFNLVARGVAVTNLAPVLGQPSTVVFRERYGHLYNSDEGTEP
jgi:hypothetical protein